MNEIHVTSCVIATTADANKALFRVPQSTSGYGGITITGAYYVPAAAGTLGACQLNNNGTALGTAITATVGTLAASSGTTVAGVPIAITVSTAYQATGTWLAFFTTNASVTHDKVVIEWMWGK